MYGNMVGNTINLEVSVLIVSFMHLLQSAILLNRLPVDASQVVSCSFDVINNHINLRVHMINEINHKLLAEQ